MRLQGLILAVAALAWPCRADTISYSDTEFADGDWVHIEEADSTGAATLSVTQIASGGNPGAYQRGTHTWTAASSVVYAHLFDATGGASLDPAGGAITGIGFSFDASVFSPTATSTFDPAVGFRFLLEQDGSYYINDSALITSQSEGWETHSLTGLTALNFIALNGTGGADPTDHPDFSSTGGVMRFGYVSSNTANRAFENQWGVDNWSVTVNTLAESDGGADPVPEPGTLVLFAASLIGYGVCRRRRLHA